MVFRICFPYVSIVFSNTVENGATSAIYIHEVTRTRTDVTMKKGLQQGSNVAFVKIHGV